MGALLALGFQGHALGGDDPPGEDQVSNATREAYRKIRGKGSAATSAGIQEMLRSAVKSRSDAIDTQREEQDRQLLEETRAQVSRLRPSRKTGEPEKGKTASKQGSTAPVSAVSAPGGDNGPTLDGSGVPSEVEFGSSKSRKPGARPSVKPTAAPR